MPHERHRAILAQSGECRSVLSIRFGSSERAPKRIEIVVNTVLSFMASSAFAHCILCEFFPEISAWIICTQSSAHITRRADPRAATLRVWHQAAA